MTYGQKGVTKTIIFKVVVLLHIVVVVALSLFLGFSNKKRKMVRILPVGLVGQVPGPVASSATKVESSTTAVKKKEPKVVKKKVPKVAKKKAPKVVKKKAPKVVKKKVPKVVKKKVPKVVKKKAPKVVKKKVKKKRVPKVSQEARMAQMRNSLKRRVSQEPRVKPSTPTRFDATAIRKKLGQAAPSGGGGGVPGSYTQSVGQRVQAEWQNFKAWVGTDESEKVLVNVTWNRYGTITNYQIITKSGNAQLNAKVERFLLYMKTRVKLPAFPSSMVQLAVTKPFEISR